MAVFEFIANKFNYKEPLGKAWQESVILDYDLWYFFLNNYLIFNKRMKFIMILWNKTDVVKDNLTELLKLFYSSDEFY